MTAILAAHIPGVGSCIAADGIATGADVRVVPSKLHRVAPWLTVGVSGSAAGMAWLRHAGRSLILPDEVESEDEEVRELDDLFADWRAWRDGAKVDPDDVWFVLAGRFGVYEVQSAGVVESCGVMDSGVALANGGSGGPAAAVAWHVLARLERLGALPEVRDLSGLRGRLMDAVEATCGVIAGCGDPVTSEIVTPAGRRWA